MEPSAMRWYHQIRRARIFTLAAVIVASSVSAFGQSGQLRLSTAGPSALQGVAQQPGETVRQLSIDEATKLALEQNLGIRIQRFDPQIQDIGIAFSRSFWAPQLSSTITRKSADQPVTSILSGTQPVVTTGQFATG